MPVNYVDIGNLTKKSSVGGAEKLPVSGIEYITPAQIIEYITPAQIVGLLSMGLGIVVHNNTVITRIVGSYPVSSGAITVSTEAVVSYKTVVIADTTATLTVAADASLTDGQKGIEQYILFDNRNNTVDCVVTPSSGFYPSGNSYTVTAGKCLEMSYVVIGSTYYVLFSNPF
jgi:hypothetical protein